MPLFMCVKLGFMLREDYTLRMFQNGALSRICEPKRKEVNRRLEKIA
jgi:hypothetical protein